MHRFGSHQYSPESKNRDNQPKAFFLPILTIGLIALFSYAIFWSNLFMIKNVEFTGNVLIDANLMRSQIDEQTQLNRFWFLSQKNILAFDEKLAISNLQQPRIASIKIKKKLPHTLHVDIVEKSATAIWNVQNNWYEIDNAGQIIGQIGGPETGSLVLFNSNSFGQVIDGSVVTNKDAIESVKTIDANLLRTIDLDVIKYDVGDYNNYTIIAKTKSGIDVKFNTQLSIVNQIKKLNEFLIQKSAADESWKNGLSYIDLRFGNSRVYYK